MAEVGRSKLPVALLAGRLVSLAITVMLNAEIGKCIG
jgi:hypothetical protein